MGYFLFIFFDLWFLWAYGVQMQMFVASKSLSKSHINHEIFICMLHVVIIFNQVDHDLNPTQKMLLYVTEPNLNII
jgi:hypothetical protein